MEKIGRFYQQNREKKKYEKKQGFKQKQGEEERKQKIPYLFCLIDVSAKKKKKGEAEGGEDK